MRANGTAIDQVVRAGSLLAMAAFTRWRIRASAAAVLLIGALAGGVLAVMAYAGH